MKLFKSNQLKKLMILLLSFFTIQFFILNYEITFASNLPKVTYTIEGNTSIGSNIKVNINISNVTDLYGGSVDFLYDPTIIKINSIDAGNIFGSLNPIKAVNIVDNNSGQSNIALTLKGDIKGVSNTGTLAVINATVLKSGKLNIKTISNNDPLSLTGSTIRVKLSDSNAKAISYTAENKEISFTGQTGWVQSNGTWYYYDTNGKPHTGWLNDGGTWYFFNSSGAMHTGWLNDGGTWYFFNGSGAMHTGWYFFNGSGAMHTGWLNDGGTWYFFNGSGAMHTGWLNDGGTWYFFNTSGAMYTGWLNDGSTWYYLYSNGKMATNTTIDGWVINSSGVARPK